MAGRKKTAVQEKEQGQKQEALKVAVEKEKRASAKKRTGASAGKTAKETSEKRGKKTAEKAAKTAGKSAGKSAAGARGRSAVRKEKQKTEGQTAGGKRGRKNAVPVNLHRPAEAADITPAERIAAKRMTRPVYVVGHRNPDTDAICAAITYANLKREITGEAYEARRAGDLNNETRFVLKKFGVEPPPLLDDVRTQVKDIEIRQMPGASGDLSMKRAWELMEEADVVTLCITNGDTLEGLITTGDIVRSYMDIYDADFISKARTSYRNILDTIDGELLAGDPDGFMESGKVLVAASSPEMMEHFVDPGDVVLLGNRYESQLCAIELNAKILIICGGAEVADTIIKLANEHGCLIMRSAHDTFTVARLINQSVPIRYFMKSGGLVYFRTDHYIEDIQEEMARRRFRYFPVIDKYGAFVGMISRRNFLGAIRKRLILVDHNERAQAVHGVESAEILEIIDHHRVASVQTIGPVYFRNQPLGCTCTIIYQMYQENGVKIDRTMAGLMLSAILSDTLMYRSPTCTPADKAAGDALAKIAGVEVEKYAREMFRAGSNLSGKTPEEIINMDFKRFAMEGMNFGIGQVSSMSAEELDEIRARVMPEMEEERREQGLDMLFLLLTHIPAETSYVICAGESAPKLIFSAFGAEQADERAVLPGVVSRKKQFLPGIAEALQRRA